MPTPPRPIPPADSKGTRAALIFALTAERLSIYYEHGQWLTEAQGGTALLRRDIAGTRQEGTKPVGAFSLSPPGLAIPVEVLGPHHIRTLAIESQR